MTAETIQKPGVLAAAREISTALLMDTHDANAVGLDAYSREPVYHAMADGKFLSALAASREHGIISEIVYQKFSAAAVERLVQHSIMQADTAAWGLGFEWGGLPENEPYVITTCVVARGLAETEGEAAGALLARAVRWLEDRASTDEPLPAFSPHVPRRVFNVIAAWAGVMWVAGQREAAERAFEWVLSHRVPSVGWTYEPGSVRIDLLHEMYTIDALALAGDDLPGRPDLERTARSVLALFSTPDGLLDKADLLDEAAAVESVSLARRTILRPVGDHWLVLHANPARPWSYGETLRVASRFADTGPNEAYWSSTLLRLCEIVVGRWEEILRAAGGDHPNPRDTMHLAHGLACAAGILRKRRQA